MYNHQRWCGLSDALGASWSFGWIGHVNFSLSVSLSKVRLLLDSMPETEMLLKNCSLVSYRSREADVLQVTIILNMDSMRILEAAFGVPPCNVKASILLLPCGEKMAMWMVGEHRRA